MGLSVHQLLFFLMFYVSTFSIVSSASFSLNTDREALLSFESQMSQNPQSLSFSWDPNTSPCNWTGVTCDTRIRRVASINLSGHGLSGSISPSIGNLSFLTSLQLQNNQLRGPIPKEITNLFRLRVLNLSSNSLDGSLPSNLSKLIELRALDLTSNMITGIVPNQLGDLKNLTILNLGKNLLHGPIPPSLSNISSLTVLSLGTNSLSGPVPNELGRLQRLQVLDLTINNLSGTIPPSIYNMSSLESLVIASNNFWGQFPSNIGYTLPKLLVFNVYSIGDLGALNEINLSHNKLQGRIPPSFENFKNMLSMDLSSNMLNGSIPNGVLNLPSLSHIPSSIKDCQSLEKLNMAGNNLDGPIPDALAEVKGLEFLDLSSNQLSGVIPPRLQDLQAMKFLNISFNNLEGWVPNRGVFKDRSKAYMEGNPKLCIHTCRKTRTHRKLLKVSEKRSTTSTSSSNSLLKEPFMNVSYDELRRATENFNPRNLLGVGSFGSVFKGVIRGVDVAVKVIDLKANGYYKGFIAECEALRNVRHRNLVKLVTSCSSIDFKNNEFLALVYEFLSNGSLEEWIKGKHRKPDGSVGLSLEERVNVAIDIASALDYLHNDCEVHVVHCDLKPSNILLTEDMVAKVGDFGLARVLFDASDDCHHASISSTHVLKGSIGYIPPEYGLGEKPSQAGDVYSFGVMLLELLSGKSPMDERFEGDQNLISWISYGFQSNAIMEVIDPKLKGLIDVSGAQLHAKLDCLKKTIEVGLACTAYAASERMKMRNVLRLLKEAKGMLIKGN
ncbi:BnaA02g23670D [Brassica napus]|uniref:non-specific serine/threonine protein kinase n=1 Tax=Brassica napus TaxID=3708 RepID=A0A078GP11_BRANA|nr:BnaA02g23670D [Brassica napus]